MIRLIQQNTFLVFIIVISIIFITSYIIGKSKEENKETTVREFYALGTIIRLRVDGNNGERAIEGAIDRLNIIENKMSVFKEFSEVSIINKKAGVANQIVSWDTYFVIKKAVELGYQKELLIQLLNL